MFRTKKAAQAWVEREGVAVSRTLFFEKNDRYRAVLPGHPAIVAYGRTYLEAVNALITAIDDARASDARAMESEIPW